VFLVAVVVLAALAEAGMRVDEPGFQNSTALAEHRAMPQECLNLERSPSGEPGRQLAELG
jgi:hypothetical protein